MIRGLLWLVVGWLESRGTRDTPAEPTREPDGHSLLTGGLRIPEGERRGPRAGGSGAEKTESHGVGMRSNRNEWLLE